MKLITAVLFLVDSCNQHGWKEEGERKCLKLKRNFINIIIRDHVNEMCLFQDFNLNIEKGEFVSVVGSNGSGKDFHVEYYLWKYSGRGWKDSD